MTPIRVLPHPSPPKKQWRLPALPTPTPTQHLTTTPLSWPICKRRWHHTRELSALIRPDRTTIPVEKLLPESRRRRPPVSKPHTALRRGSVALTTTFTLPCGSAISGRKLAVNVLPPKCATSSLDFTPATETSTCTVSFSKLRFFNRCWRFEIRKKYYNWGQEARQKL